MSGMRRSKGSKWEFSVGEPQHLVYALFIRDAAGLRPVTYPVIPALRPEVPSKPSLVPETDRGRVTTQWEEWWQRLWETEPELRRASPVPRDVLDVSEHDELQHVATALHDASNAYCAERKRELKASVYASRLPHQTPEAEVLAQATRWRVLRRPRPVRVRVTELPVATEQAWHASPGHIVVTRSLRENVAAYQEWLEPVARGLAKRA